MPHVLWPQCLPSTGLGQGRQDLYAPWAFSLHVKSPQDLLEQIVFPDAKGDPPFKVLGAASPQLLTYPKGNQHEMCVFGDLSRHLCAGGPRGVTQQTI